MTRRSGQKPVTLGIAITIAICGCATYSRPGGGTAELAIVENSMRYGFLSFRFVQVGHVDGKMVIGSGEIPLVPGEHALELRYVENSLGTATYGDGECTVLLPAQANHRYSVHGEPRGAAILGYVEWVGWIENTTAGVRYECKFK